jgi:carboxypeptidase Q
MTGWFPAIAPGGSRRATSRERDAWTNRITKTGLTTRTLPVALEDAGARGILTSTWSAGWGVTRIFNARTRKVPTLDLSCEDYGLLYRLAENNQSPVIQVEAQAETMGDVPVFNTIARVPAGVIPSVARDLRRQSQTSLEIPR